MLHMDRLPPPLAKPHHQRLARTALARLQDLDHAQSFELSRGRLAIVWRSRTAHDIDVAMADLGHLLSDLPRSQAVPLGQLVSLFDLPAQAPWLLDVLDNEGLAAPDTVHQGLDPPLLEHLEQLLPNADLSPFVRSRPVMDIARATPVPAWDDRSIALPELASALCPGRHIDESSVLFRLLSRSIERYVVAQSAAPRALSGSHAFAVPLSVATILSPAFLAFDAALPAGLRGHVLLKLSASDILSDASNYLFARDFAQARGYRLILPAAPTGLLDIAATGVDLIEVMLTVGLQRDAGMLPDRSRLILTCVDDGAALAWARMQGCPFAAGMAFPA